MPKKPPRPDASLAPKPILRRLSDFPPYVPPEYPKAVTDCYGRLCLRIEDGREYWVGQTPVEFLRVLRHLSTKTWCSAEFLQLAIERVAAVRDWEVGA